MVSTLWNQSAPYIIQAGELAMNTFHTVTGIDTESVWPMGKYVGWLIVGFLAIGVVGWRGWLALLGYIRKRTKKVADARNGTRITSPPATEALSRAEASTSAQPGPSLSGPTSGEAIEDGAILRISCQSGRMVFGGNYFRPMDVRKRRLSGNAKPDLLYLGRVVMAHGNIISSKKGRVEVSLLKRHLCEYVASNPASGARRETCMPAGFW